MVRVKFSCPAALLHSYQVCRESKNGSDREIRTIPAQRVYLYKNAAGELFMSEAKNLRARVAPISGRCSRTQRKTFASAEAVDVDYIVWTTKRSFGLGKQSHQAEKPRFNILLRDDKTYPYINYPGERFPGHETQAEKRRQRVYGPYFRKSGLSDVI